MVKGLSNPIKGKFSANRKVSMEKIPWMFAILRKTGKKNFSSGHKLF